MSKLQRRQSMAMYERLPRSNRTGSMCATLSPVMEHEPEEVKKSTKRRFSLDFLFSKKKNRAKENENAKRKSTDSNSSIEADNVILNPESEFRRPSFDNNNGITKIKSKKAEITAYCFS